MKFNRNLGDLKMHTGPPSAIGLTGSVLTLIYISVSSARFNSPFSTQNLFELKNYQQNKGMLCD